MLEKIKIILDITDNDKDDKLKIMIDMAVESIKNYLKNDKFDNEYILKNFEIAVIELVCKSYMCKEAKNIKQMSQGSRSITYANTNTNFLITDDIAQLLPAPFLKMM